MSDLNILDRAIRFHKPWNKQENLMEDIRRHRRDLPSASQWHRFREHVLRAEDPDKIREFLEGRKERKKVRGLWTFRFRNQNFDEFLIGTFVQKIEDAREISDLRGTKYFGLDDSRVSAHVLLNHKPEVKLAILKKILLKFIDHVLLITEGLHFRFKDGRTEIIL